MMTIQAQRQPLRLRDYDYSASGAYFVTICTQDRWALFGEIVNGEMCLNDAGRMVQTVWQSLPDRFPGWFIDVCVVMPDHFHGILIREETLNGEIVGAGLCARPDYENITLPLTTDRCKQPSMRRGGSLCPPDYENGTVPLTTRECEQPPINTGTETRKSKGRAGTETRPYGLSDIVQSFKSYTTHQYGRAVIEKGWPRYSQRLWQRNYYEHVIRNEQDLVATRDYIANNPQKWQQQHTVGARSNSGFTLVELVVVIVIVGILAALGGQFIVAPVKGYIDLARRTRLVDQADLALRRMQRDIRHALPNSIRIDGKYLEMLNTVGGGRYRRYPDPDTDPAIGKDILDFSVADTSFDVLGSLSRVPQAGDFLVVYNTSSSGLTGNAYASSAGNLAAVGAGSTVSQIILDPGFDFAFRSPRQRFFVVDEPVTYACEGGVLNRYAGYTLSAAQPNPPVTTPALVTGNVDVSKCEFSYDPGASQRAGLVTLRLTLFEADETITLLHQVHVVNAP